MIAESLNFRRSTRYKLISAIRFPVRKGNAQAPETLAAEDVDVGKTPTYLALHDFDGAIDMAAILATGQTEWSKRILGSVRLLEAGIWTRMVS